MYPKMTDSNDEVTEDVDDVTSKINEFDILSLIGEERGVMMLGDGLVHSRMRSAV